MASARFAAFDRRSAAWALFGVLCAGAAPAQGPAAGDVLDRVVTLQPVGGLEGARMALYRGEVRTTAHRYALDGLSVLQPVSVTLLAPPGSGIGLRISKLSDEALREGAVGADGTLTYRFRTEGGFYAKVSGTGTQLPYRLLVLVGDLMTPQLAPLFTSLDDFERRGGARQFATPAAAAAAPAATAPAAAAAADGSGSSAALWAIALGLFAVAAVLLVLLLRRKPS